MVLQKLYLSFLYLIALNGYSIRYFRSDAVVVAFDLIELIEEEL